MLDLWCHVSVLILVQFSRSVVSHSLPPHGLQPCVPQASLSLTYSRSLFKLMSIESGMPSNHLILCRPLLLPSVLSSIRAFSNESVLRIRWPKYWSFSFSISDLVSTNSSLKYVNQKVKRIHWQINCQGRF